MTFGGPGARYCLCETHAAMVTSPVRPMRHRASPRGSSHQAMGRGGEDKSSGRADKGCYPLDRSIRGDPLAGRAMFRRERERGFGGGKQSYSTAKSTLISTLISPPAGSEISEPAKWKNRRSGGGARAHRISGRSPRLEGQGARHPPGRTPPPMEVHVTASVYNHAAGHGSTIP